MFREQIWVLDEDLSGEIIFLLQRFYYYVDVYSLVLG